MPSIPVHPFEPAMWSGLEGEKPAMVIPESVVPGYESLYAVLFRALDQAQAGKGAERHAQGQPFDQQPMQSLIKLYGPGFALGQAAKKSQEALRLPTRDRQVAELLGAINYIAGAVIALEATKSEGSPE